MNRFICIHAHFYQPPRENPWLESVERQDSAHPYHDWNERISTECYAANAASRVLDPQGRIVEIVNNYAKISFNFGPTLLSWLEEKAPEVYQGILEADRQSQKNFSGHGSAMAQPYNHMILPLSNRRDRVTQVRWGIRDFVRRFGRQPEGMWLPEAAVDVETLEILAENGILFTVLAPHQARRVRPLGGRAWKEVTGARIDPRVPYTAVLPSKRKIHLFFYDGPVSRAVAFEKLLTRGETFAQRLMESFPEGAASPELVHIATDGETYGHHHRFGEMALSYAIRHIEEHGLARITNYGEHLQKRPPTQQVEIWEKTSWSCAHGVDRWWSDCGCNSGGNPGWNQTWRTPLRNALDWVREETARPYEEMGRGYFKDPWAARDGYIEVVLDRSADSVNRFFEEQSGRTLSPEERVAALKLLELQRHAMLMYTSCGWFFDELTGIETVQVLQYAGRAIQLAEDLFGRPFEPHFLGLLEQARSNLPRHGNGRQVYEKFVRPSRVDMERMGAHYAVNSLFQEYVPEDRVHCYWAERRDSKTSNAGKARLVIGRVRLVSQITQEAQELSFGVQHMGDHNVNCGVRIYRGEEPYAEMRKKVEEAFARADFAEVIRFFDGYFGESNYSLRSIFRDEQHRALKTILRSTLEEAEAAYGQIYHNYAPLMRFLSDLGIPSPPALTMAAEFVLNSQLRRALGETEFQPDKILALVENSKKEGVPLDWTEMEFSARPAIRRLAEKFREKPEDPQILAAFSRGVEVVRSFPVPVHLWEAQNICCDVRRSLYPKLRDGALEADEAAARWIAQFGRLCEGLRVRLE